MNKQYIEQYHDKISKLSREDQKQRNIYLRELSTGEIQGPPTGIPSIDQPWLTKYPENMLNFELPNMTVYEFAKEINKDNLDSIALEYYGTKITYRTLFEKIDEVEKSFRKMGIKQGDFVSLCVPTIPETFYIFYALNKIGAIPNLIDPRIGSELITKYIRESNSKAIIYVDNAYPKLRPIIDELNIPNIISLSVKNSFSSITKVGYELKSFIDDMKDKKSVKKYLEFKKKFKIPSKKKIIDWNDFIEFGKNYEFKSEELNDKLSLLAGVVYTSGTTGTSKGGKITNQNILAMKYQNVAANMGWDRNDIILGIMPPFIAYGLVCGLTLPLCNGMQINIIPKFEPKSFGNLILKHHPQHIMGVPAYLEYLLEDKKLQNKDLSHLKSVIVGGDKLVIKTEDRINQFLADHGAKIVVSKGYGMTEMSSNAIYTVNIDCNELGSVGIPLVENSLRIFKIKYDENGEEVKEDELDKEEAGYDVVGEVYLSGPTLIEGYLNNPQEDAKTFIVRNGKRWVRTGDIARMTKEGLVFFEDRKKRMISRSDGHNTWPDPIEKLINQQPNVIDSCVVGVKDPNLENGFVPTAFIVFDKEGLISKGIITKEIDNAALERLGERDKALKYYKIDELPLTPVGKVDYKLLSEKGITLPGVEEISISETNDLKYAGNEKSSVKKRIRTKK